MLTGSDEPTYLPVLMLLPFKAVQSGITGDEVLPACIIRTSRSRRFGNNTT